MQEGKCHCFHLFQLLWVFELDKPPSWKHYQGIITLIFKIRIPVSMLQDRHRSAWIFIYLDTYYVQFNLLTTPFFYLFWLQMTHLHFTLAPNASTLLWSKIYHLNKIISPCVDCKMISYFFYLFSITKCFTKWKVNLVNFTFKACSWFS